MSYYSGASSIRRLANSAVERPLARVRSPRPVRRTEEGTRAWYMAAMGPIIRRTGDSKLRKEKKMITRQGGWHC
jgi:hypothetical protein